MSKRDIDFSDGKYVAESDSVSIVDAKAHKVLAKIQAGKAQNASKSSTYQGQTIN
jgi:YVTN family beta-propeller protein